MPYCIECGKEIDPDPSALCERCKSTHNKSKRVIEDVPQNIIDYEMEYNRKLRIAKILIYVGSIYTIIVLILLMGWLLTVFSDLLPFFSVIPISIIPISLIVILVLGNLISLIGGTKIDKDPSLAKKYILFGGIISGANIFIIISAILIDD